MSGTGPHAASFVCHGVMARIATTAMHVNGNAIIKLRLLERRKPKLNINNTLQTQTLGPYVVNSKQAKRMNYEESMKPTRTSTNVKRISERDLI